MLGAVGAEGSYGVSSGIEMMGCTVGHAFRTTHTHTIATLETRCKVCYCADRVGV